MYWKWAALPVGVLAATAALAVDSVNDLTGPEVNVVGGDGIEVTTGETIQLNSAFGTKIDSTDILDNGLSPGDFTAVGALDGYVITYVFGVGPRWRAPAAAAAAAYTDSLRYGTTTKDWDDYVTASGYIDTMFVDDTQWEAYIQDRQTAGGGGAITSINSRTGVISVMPGTGATIDSTNNTIEVGVALGTDVAWAELTAAARELADDDSLGGKPASDWATDVESAAWDIAAVAVHSAAHDGDTSAHGVAEIVGTSDAQTLTTKTINADNNTISNIGSAEITDLGVGTADIAANAITSTKMANNAISNARMMDNSVDSPEIVDGAIDGTHFNMTGSAEGYVLTDSSGVAVWETAGGLDTLYVPLPANAWNAQTTTIQGSSVGPFVTLRNGALSMNWCDIPWNETYLDYSTVEFRTAYNGTAGRDTLQTFRLGIDGIPLTDANITATDSLLTKDVNISFSDTTSVKVALLEQSFNITDTFYSGDRGAFVRIQSVAAHAGDFIHMLSPTLVFVP